MTDITLGDFGLPDRSHARPRTLAPRPLPGPSQLDVFGTGSDLEDLRAPIAPPMRRDPLLLPGHAVELLTGPQAGVQPEDQIALLPLFDEALPEALRALTGLPSEPPPEGDPKPSDGAATRGATEYGIEPSGTLPCGIPYLNIGPATTGIRLLVPEPTTPDDLLGPELATANQIIRSPITHPKAALDLARSGAACFQVRARALASTTLHQHLSTYLDTLRTALSAEQAELDVAVPILRAGREEIALALLRFRRAVEEENEKLLGSFFELLLTDARRIAADAPDQPALQLRALLEAYRIRVLGFDASRTRQIARLLGIVERTAHEIMTPLVTPEALPDLRRLLAAHVTPAPPDAAQLVAPFSEAPRTPLRAGLVIGALIGGSVAFVALPDMPLGVTVLGLGGAVLGALLARTRLRAAAPQRIERNRGEMQEAVTLLAATLRTRTTENTAALLEPLRHALRHRCLEVIDQIRSQRTAPVVVLGRHMARIAQLLDSVQQPPAQR